MLRVGCGGSGGDDGGSDAVSEDGGHMILIVIGFY